MGFFKDFKEDLSEAVNGLSDAELENATDDGDEDLMVNTLDDPELAKMAESYNMEVEKLKEFMGENEKKQMKEDLAVQEAVTFLVENAVEK